MAGTRITTTGVLYINGQQVETTFNNLRRSTTQLERQLRNLTPGTEEFVRTAEELRRVRQRFNEVREEINETNNALGRWTDIFKGNIAADFFNNVASKAMELGKQLKERVEELVKIKSTLSSLDDNLKGLALDRAAVTVQSIADTYGKGVEEITGAVKALNAQTGDTNKSLDLIKKGFDAGADSSGEMLTQLKEYPTMMNDAKVSAEEMIAIMAQSEKMGIYDDKGIDAIKEGMLRVREGTKTAKDAMTALGIDTVDVYKKVASGALTYFDVLKIVSGKIKDTGANSRVTGTAIADIFGGPGEDAGFRYLSQLKDINLNLDELTAATSDAAIAKKKELEANEKLNSVWVKLTGTASVLSQAYSSVKSGLAETLAYIFKIKETKLSDEYLEQQNRLVYLKSQLDRTNVSQAKKLEIFQALKTEFPTYFSGLNLEKIKHEEITKAINGTIDALGRKYKAQVFQELTTDSSKKSTEDYRKAIKIQTEGEKLLMELQQKYSKSGQLDFNFKSNTTINQLRELQTQYKSISANVRDSGTESAIDGMIDRMSKANLAAQASEKERIKNQKILIDLQSKVLPEPFKIVANTDKPSTDRDLDAEAAAKKAAEAAAKKAEKERISELKKTENQKKADLKESEKMLIDSNNTKLELEAKFLSDSAELQDESLKKEIDKENTKRSVELAKQKEEQDSILRGIKELEKKISETKSTEAKENFELALKEERFRLQTHDQVILLAEDTHQKKISIIRQNWSAKEFEKYVKSEKEKIEESRRLREEEIININSVEDAKAQLIDSQYLKLTDLELKNIKTLEQAKAALREEADRKMLAAQLVSLEGHKVILEKQLKGLTGPAAKQLKDNLKEISKAITDVKSAINGKGIEDKGHSEAEKLSAKEKVDILGFSVKDWEDTFSNIKTLEDGLKAAATIFQAMGNAAGTYAELQRALGERELKQFEKVQHGKKSELDRQLSLGLISQENYKKQTELLDAELANKQAEIEYKQAKAEKTSRLFSAIGATAMGIANSLAIGGPVGIAMAAIVGVLGAVQIGAIAAQPLPEPPSYAEGGFPFFEGFTGESNLPADSSGERPVGLAKLHRKEFVVPRWMTEHPVISKRVNELDYIRRTKNIPEFADGGFVDPNATNGVAPNPNVSNSDTIQYIAVMNDVKKLLQMIYDEGIEAHITENAKNGKKMNRMVKNWQILENKNKH